MNIPSSLLKFLQSNVEADLGTLGVFKKKRITGRFDKTKKAFIPPRFELNFHNSGFGKNEAFFDFVAKENDVSIDESKQNIKDFFANIESDLAKNKEVKISGLGKFSSGKDGNINFEADKNLVIDASYFGLPNVNDEEQIPSESKEDLNMKENSPKNLPIVENIELDEVKTDLANTLSHVQNADENQVEVPESIKEQHEEHPGKFGSTPHGIENVELDEVTTDFANTLSHLKNVEGQETEVEDERRKTKDESTVETDDERRRTKDENTVDTNQDKPKEPVVAIESSAEKAHAIEQTNVDEEKATPIVEPPLSEEEKTAVFTDVPVDENEHLPRHNAKIDETVNVPRVQEEIIAVPEAVLEQHEEYPNRFGTDPMEYPTEKSIWPKVFVAFIVLLIIGGLVYFFQPNLFNRTTDPIAKTVLPTDSTKTQLTAIDTAKFKQDSTAKADSVLKANMVQTGANDTLTGSNGAKNNPITTFDVIVASYKYEKDANAYVALMKSKGYDAKIAHMVGTRKKISVASFQTEQEAKKQLIILQRKLRGKGFYVQKIKTP